MPFDIQVTAAAEKFLKKAEKTLLARIADKLPEFPPFGHHFLWNYP